MSVVDLALVNDHHEGARAGAGARQNLARVRRHHGFDIDARVAEQPTDPLIAHVQPLGRARQGGWTCAIRLTLRTSNAVATSSASPSRCFLFCDGSRAARSARTAAATVSTPPIPKAPPNQRRRPPITSTFQAARLSDGW